MLIKGDEELGKNKKWEKGGVEARFLTKGDGIISGQSRDGMRKRKDVRSTDKGQLKINGRGKKERHDPASPS